MPPISCRTPTLSVVTTQSAPRPFWLAACGGLAGIVVGAGWTWFARAVFLTIDDAGFRWPLPLPLAILATVLTAIVMWAPWVPLFLRVGFPWWFVIVGVVPIVGIGLAGSVGVRLATGTGRPRGQTRTDPPRKVAGAA
jgi:hypothetical protein